MRQARAGRLVLILAIGLLLSVAMDACSESNVPRGGPQLPPSPVLAPSSSPTPQAQVSPAASASAQLLVVGGVAPDFTLPATTGQDVRLSSFRGKAVLIEFLATW